MTNKDVIIACDFSSAEATLAFLDLFPEGEKPFVKIGMELYYAAGPEIVREIKRRGHRIFLDLKLHDIPNTVRKAMAVLSKMDVDMVNVHASGGSEMMRAAVEGLTRPDGSRPLLIAVTQLTSTSEEMLHNELLIASDMKSTIARYALNAKESGLDGVVCSPLEAAEVKRLCGDGFLTVTPGIRFADAAKDDQVRIATPANASGMGSDFIVVGRPITAAEDPVAAYRRCVSEFCAGTEEKVAAELLKIGAVFLRPENPFTWASGIKSPIYCDNRLILTSPSSRDIVEKAIAAKVKELYPEADVLMGTSTAGIAHAAIAAGILGIPMGYVRSSAKDHGRTNRIEGKLEAGDKVVVIEDLISTGGSCIEVVEALREAGAEVLGIISIFTYGLKAGLEKLAAANMENHSLSNLDALVEVAARTGYIKPEDVKRILAFRAEPSNPNWINL